MFLASDLARYVTGLEIEELCADVSTFVEGRRIDDDANLLVRYRGGAKGLVFCSQISLGEENRLTLRVYGTEASLEWQERAVEVLLQDWACSRILGRDPFDIEAVVGDMVRDQYQGGSTVMTARAVS